MKRIFTAISFDPDNREKLHTLFCRMEDQILSGRVTPRDNIHLTVEFLGDTDPIGVAAVLQILRDTPFEPFEVATAGWGSFSRRGSALLWLGLEPDPKLLTLQAALRRKLKAAGFAVESRPYRPHLTAVRNVRLPQGFQLPETEAGEQIVQRVDRVCLLESVFTPEGVRYRELTESEEAPNHP
jgi:2'-5' RNA ligase